MNIACIYGLQYIGTGRVQVCMYIHVLLYIVSPLWPNPVESKMSVDVCTLGLTLEVINVVNGWTHGHDFTNIVAM